MNGTNDISRRALLGSLGTVGGAGAVFGAGTTSLFIDRELIETSEVSAGLLDILVSWEDGAQTSEDGTATVTFDLSDGSDKNILTVTHTDKRSNPASIWFRPTCPTGPADSVNVTATVCDTEVGSGSLLHVANDLRNGIRLDTREYCGECIGPDEEIELEIDWEFSASDDYDSQNPDDVELEFHFRAIQCRSNPDPSNPFEEIDPCIDTTEYHGISYIKVFASLEGECSEIGKLELDNNLIQEGESYEFSEVKQTEYDDYQIEVIDTVTKDDGQEVVAVEFELNDPDGSDPDLCDVHIKGGSGQSGGGVIEYTSGFDGNATGRLLYAPEKEVGSE
jgi:hypothetical protein